MGAEPVEMRRAAFPLVVTSSALLTELGCANEARKKFITPHPSAEHAASHSQRTTKHLRETKMTKIASIAAAFVLFAPVAVAIFAQAAQIVA
ncbi:MAG: hypothetical protein JNL81_01015 [Hyphomonadaceae bacterium]|nr:hypothetical protein [Hyphomonadaceae bacterium]